MFGKILVPLDGSMLSEKALPYALRLAKQLEVRLSLIRVVDAEAGLLPASHKQEATMSRAATKYLARLEKILTDPQNELALQPRQLQTQLVYGEPAREISNFATSCQADVIVMTTHGRSGLGRLVLGSVASAVVHQSSVPVMLIHPFQTRYDQLLTETLNEVGEPFSSQCFSGPGGKILLTLDGSVRAETALEPALELASRLEAHLYLLHVNQPLTMLTSSYLASMGYDEADLIRIQNEATTEAYNYLDEASVLAQAFNIPCTSVVTSSQTPAQEITRYADELEAELIIMATHAPGELGRAFGGSVAESVVQQSHRPILLVQSRSKVKEKKPVLQPI